MNTTLLPSAIMNYMESAEIDLINDTISVIYSYSPDLNGSSIADFDIGPCSPLFHPLDSYYRSVCGKLFPGSERWHGNWPLMLAQINSSSLLSEPLSVVIETKWFVSRADIDGLLAIFENLDAAYHCGLTTEFICGVDDDVAYDDDDQSSMLAAAVYPLNIKLTRRYPFNFHQKLWAEPEEITGRQISSDSLTAIAAK